MVGLIQRAAGSLLDSSLCALSDCSDVLIPSRGDGVKKPLQILGALVAPSRGTTPGWAAVMDRFKELGSQARERLWRVLREAVRYSPFAGLESPEGRNVVMNLWGDVICVCERVNVSAQLPPRNLCITGRMPPGGPPFDGTSAR